MNSFHKTQYLRLRFSGPELLLTLCVLVSLHHHAALHRDHRLGQAGGLHQTQAQLPGNIPLSYLLVNCTSRDPKLRVCLILTDNANDQGGA